MALQENSRIFQWASTVDAILRKFDLALYDGGTGTILLPLMAGGSWLTASMIIVMQTPDAGVPQHIRVWPFMIGYMSNLPDPGTFVSLVMAHFAEKSKLIKEGDIIPTGTKIEELLQ